MEHDISDQQLREWYSHLLIALEHLNKVPASTKDYGPLYPHGEALLESKAYLNQTIATLMVELERRGLPYGYKDGAIIEEQRQP